MNKITKQLLRHDLIEMREINTLQSKEIKRLRKENERMMHLLNIAQVTIISQQKMIKELES